MAKGAKSDLAAWGFDEMETEDEGFDDATGTLGGGRDASSPERRAWATLPAFSLLADPDAIARGGGEDPRALHDEQDEAWRLRAELSRRAAEVEELRRDLSLELTLRADRDRELEKLRDEVERARDQISRRLQRREVQDDQERARDESQDRQLLEARVALATAREEREQERAARKTSEARAHELEQTLALAHAKLREQQERLDGAEASLTPLAEQLREREQLVSELSRALQQGDPDGNAARRPEAREARNDQARLELEALREENAGLRSALTASEGRSNRRKTRIDELENTLDLARQGIESRRSEIEALQRTLAEAAEIRESLCEQRDELGSELQALRASEQAVRAELEELRGTERALECTIEVRDREIQTLGERLALAQKTSEARAEEVGTLRDRLAERDDRERCLEVELEAVRQQVLDERAKGQRELQELETLRETLALIGRTARSGRPTAGASEESEGLPAPTADEPGTAPAPRGPVAGASAERPPSPTPAPDRVGPVAGESTAPSPDAAEAPEPAGEAGDPAAGANAREELLAAAVSAEPELPERDEGHAFYPPIHRYWRDEQVRAQLAETGHESLIGLFAEEIAGRCAKAADARLRILSLRGPDIHFERDLIAQLFARGVHDFRIERLDLAPPCAAAAGSAPATSSTGTHLIDLPPVVPGAPPALSGEYDLMVSDEALSDWMNAHGEGALATLLDHLGAHQKSGTGFAFLLAERIGGRSERNEGHAMSDRIWKLMPARYRQPREGEETPPELPEDVEARALLPLLRQRFELPVLASFGNLALRFVGPEIGHNFDPKSASDRRFIDQVASIDEARIQTGALLPVCMVGVATRSR